MSTTNSYISIKEIVSSWLLKKEKHPNSKWKIYPLAAEAIQELALTSLPLIQHVLLTRPAGQTWFDLPDGYTEYVSVGQRYGDSFRPLGVSNKLLPFPAMAGAGDLGNDFGSGYGNSAQYNWMDGAPGQAADFNPADFGSDDFLTAQAAASGMSADQLMQYWVVNGYQRTDTVIIDPVAKQIITGAHFGVDEIYLVYVGVGTVDSMTEIPVIAQAAIESYIDWKYVQNKRGGIREGGAFRLLFNKQHKILRARLNQITTTDIKQLRNQQWYGSGYRNPYWQYGQPATTTTAPVFISATSVYSGTKPTSGVLPGASIIQGFRQDYHQTQDINLAYNSVVPEIAWAAWPATEVGINGFYINPFDFGPFGPGGTFATPVYSDGFWYTETNYATEIQTVTLTHS